jgi:hydroxyacylglutathione hydrolase
MLDITPVPAFSDNYIWLIREASGRKAAVVDPGDAQPVLQVLAESGRTLTTILITHHHADHVGGVPGLLKAYPDAVVYGPAGERIRNLSFKLREGDHVSLPEFGAEFDVLDVPGHTAGHIAYVGQGALFCGDTLFAGGCGRLFEGTPQQMQASLSKLRQLPDETLVYCAHEYTLANLGFAKWVEPDNADLLSREQADMAQRERGQPTVPSALGLEKLTNPFLRYDVPSVVRAAERFSGQTLSDPADVFGAVRYWKDSEYD